MTFNSNTIIIFFGFPFLFVSLTACDVGEGSNSMSNNLDGVAEFLGHENGLRITLLTDDEDNETYYFEDYVFTFVSDGSVRATAPDRSVNGTYRVFRDDGRIELGMNFPDIRNFDELDDDWYFINIDQKTIRFEDSGDTLVFQPL
jgi:hypothetical protein